MMHWSAAGVIILSYLVVGYIVSSVSGMKQVNRNITPPTIAPPRATFAVVWPILYLLLGYSVYRVARTTPRPWVWYVAVCTAVLTLVAQNVWICLYSKLEFRLALYVLLLLLFFGILQMYASASVDKLGGALLAPYVAWLLFALLMNAELIQHMGLTSGICSVVAKKGENS